MSDRKWRRLRAWLKERIADAEKHARHQRWYAHREAERRDTLKGVLEVMNAESRRAQRRRGQPPAGEQEKS